MSQALLLGIGALTLALSILTAIMSALIDRSGLIRLRHWVAGSGGRLEQLYADEGRFEVFRLLLSVCSRLSLIGVLVIVTALTGSVWLAIGVTVLTTLAAELASRFFARGRAEATLQALTGAYGLASILLTPILALLGPILRFDAPPDWEDTPEDDETSDGEIDAYISVGQREGILDPGEEILVKGVVEFGDTLLRSAMTPRIDMVMAPTSTSAEDLLQLLLESGHSRLPLYGESPDHIEGVLHLRDLVAALHADAPVDVAAVCRRAFIVPDTKPIAALLRDFQARHQQLAIAVDEFGGTAGLATVEDLLEEIVGEIADEHDGVDIDRVRLDDDTWLLSGSCDVEELEELFDVEIDDAPYETVGGLIFTALGYLPEPGARVTRHGLAFEVLEVADRRIQRLRVEPASEKGT